HHLGEALHPLQAFLRLLAAEVEDQLADAESGVGRGSRPSASVSRRSSSSSDLNSGGASMAAGLAPTGCQPSPWRAARRRATRLGPPLQIGGGGFCPGWGTERGRPQ